MKDVRLNYCFDTYYGFITVTAKTSHSDVCKSLSSTVIHWQIGKASLTITRHIVKACLHW